MHFFKAKARYLLVYLIFFTITGSFAQSLTIQGKITETTGEVIPGVTLLLKGTPVRTATNNDGTYSLKTPTGSGILVISYIGYQTLEVPINNRSLINITLQTDSKALNEVVVVGYGSISDGYCLYGHFKRCVCSSNLWITCCKWRRANYH